MCTTPFWNNLCCLFFLNIPILITPLISSNSSSSGMLIVFRLESQIIQKSLKASKPTGRNRIAISSKVIYAWRKLKILHMYFNFFLSDQFLHGCYDFYIIKQSSWVADLPDLLLLSSTTSSQASEVSVIILYWPRQYFYNMYIKKITTISFVAILSIIIITRQ